MNTILGLSSGFHDAAAALLVDGELVAAVEQERLSRIKHDAAFPAAAAEVCLAIAGLRPSDVDLVACHEKPLDVVDRHLAARIRSGPAALPALLRTTPAALSTQLGLPGRIQRWFRGHGVSPGPPVQFAEHHVSHAAAAYYASPFEESAVLTVDGVGEWATTSVGHGVAHRLHVEQELRYPHSLGLLYSAFAAYCGFRPNAGEGELMGLAPYGEPRFADLIREHLVDVDETAAIRLDLRYFAFQRGRSMTSARFHRLFGSPPRPVGAPPTQREADLAASVQVVLEELMLGLARHAHRRSGARHLCLAGGVALNCVANGRIADEGPFDEVWVQPAAGDSGGAVGSALWAWHEVLGHPRTVQRDGGVAHDSMRGSFLGPRFDGSEIERWLEDRGVEHVRVPDARTRHDVVADRLSEGALVGWFTGRMEFGPRALGHRSILADPRSPFTQVRLNSAVKERADFRPFAPAVLADRASDWFDLPGEAPYMTFAFSVAPHRRRERPTGSEVGSFGERLSSVRSDIPSVTHVDMSARVQTVDAARNPEFAGLLEAFEDRTGCPVLLNTSFNDRDEPIVCTPEDALTTFRRCGLDLLVLEHCIVEAER